MPTLPTARLARQRRRRRRDQGLTAPRLLRWAIAGAVVLTVLLVVLTAGTAAAFVAIYAH